MAGLKRKVCVVLATLGLASGAVLIPAPAASASVTLPTTTDVGVPSFAVVLESVAGSAVSGFGYLEANPNGAAMELTVELSTPAEAGPLPYVVRLGGTVDADTSPESCAGAAAGIPTLLTSGKIFETGSPAASLVATPPVTRVTYEPMSIGPSPAAEIQNGEALLVVADETQTSVLACGSLVPLGNLERTTYQVTRSGGTYPVDLNSSGIVVSGTITQTGPILDIDVSFLGGEIVDGQQHMLFMGDSDECAGITWESTAANRQIALTTSGSTFAPLDPSGINDVWERSPGAGNNGFSFDYESRIVVGTGVDIGEWGLILYGLGSADETILKWDVTGPRWRDSLPSLCGTVVNQPFEIPGVPFNGTVADARSIQDIQAAANYDQVRHSEILRLYRAIFNREPDLPGAIYWIDTVHEGLGKSILEVTGFIATEDQPEFQQAYADVSTNEEFIERIYQNMLGRPAEPDGKAYWLDQMNNGLSRANTVRFVALSPEFVSRYPYPKITP